MASDAALQSSSAYRQPTWSFKIQNFSTPQTFGTKSAVESKGQQTTSSATQDTISSLGAQNTTNDASEGRQRTHTVRKKRKLDKEEEEIRNEIAASVSANLQIDQLLTQYPDLEVPFENEIDVVQRLLPYHIYQHPRHDLDKMRGLKGKGKASETDLLREEINETKFALECHKRLRSLEQRMKKARLKPGQHTAPLDQAILIERMILETEHLDKSSLDQELSTARSELDKVLRAQRLAKAAANRAALTALNTTTTTTTVNGTNSAPSYYGYTTPTFSASSTPNYSNYYGSYTYPYTQSFIPGYTAPARSTSSVPGSVYQTGATGQSQATAPSSYPPTTQSTMTSPSTTTAARPPPVAIPLQLPVTSLPALQSLGILPVPKTSLPAESNSQAAAVLLGSSNNGTMLSLEINAALLQPHQMSGLAILLSSLVKMSGGTNSIGQTTNTVAAVQSGSTAVQSTSGDGAKAEDHESK